MFGQIEVGTEEEDQTLVELLNYGNLMGLMGLIVMLINYRKVRRLLNITSYQYICRQFSTFFAFTYAL